MDVIDRLKKAPGFRTLSDRLVEAKAGGEVEVSGLWGSAAPFVAAGLGKTLKRPILYVTAHLNDADDALDDFDLFGVPCRVLPAWENLPTEASATDEILGERLKLCQDLLEETDAAKPFVVSASIHALMQAVPSPSALKEKGFDLIAGGPLDPEDLCAWLVRHGFEREDMVEQPGHFARRGGIVDIFIPGHSAPVRAEFFGEEIESLRRIDLDTQRSTEPIEQVRIAPMESLLNASLESTAGFLQYLPDETLLIFNEPAVIQEYGRGYFDRLDGSSAVFSTEAVFRTAGQFTAVQLARFGHTFDENHVKLGIESLMRFETKPLEAVDELIRLAAENDVFCFCDNPAEKQRLEQLIREQTEGVPPRLNLPTGLLHTGFCWPAIKLVLLGHHEVFHRYRQRRRIKSRAAARPIDSFLDLSPGDYVVHLNYGIGKYLGLTRKEGSAGDGEFLDIQYAGRARVKVPVTRIDRVQKYAGGFHGRPKLARVGGKKWKGVLQRAEDAAAGFAQHLIDIQAIRRAQPGIAYPEDSNWQQQFEQSFLYTDTADQSLAGERIKKDMRLSAPMDRLLCGDVGYGKTELAARAAFKAVEAGKQVAVLVPTTILAEQHYRTFRERFADYPFIIEMISRFRTRAEQKEILDRAARGGVDVLVGTHRLVSADVRFSNLGLVVIDEEQRFGVEHKERLKRLRASVDVLTMTATPIPRTLHLSLLGLRDISSLESPPQDRRAIATEVGPWSNDKIRQTVLHELDRDGQVFFVHNRVRTIDGVAETLRKIVPEARIVVGHGQMPEKQLEAVMLQFLQQKADMLVCTTIIESGVDIPTANTIFIDEADRYGLADLHQLRGRVGRYRYRAYCYLLLPASRAITPQASRRLKAIEEYSELGAGFRIAMRDLEIRGAGNILGKQQSGHIEAVGYQLYCELLASAVGRLKGESPEAARPAKAHLNLGLTGHLPRSYVSSDRQRIEIYRRLAGCGVPDDVKQLADDVRDLFGPIPVSLERLFELRELELLAGRCRIRSIRIVGPDMIFTMCDPSHVEALFTGVEGTVRLPDALTIHWRPPGIYLTPPILQDALRLRLLAAIERLKHKNAETLKR